MNSKQILNLAMVLIVSLITFASCESEKHVSEADMPTEVVSYAKLHFPDNKIVQSKIEKDNFSKKYELILEGNFKLEFNNKKEIVEIKGLSKLPDSVIPQKIREYVTTNYPDNFIKGWELDDRNQQVELDNDLDLEFTMNGEFIRIDI